ncbi:PqqD family protein [Streptomyces sp. NPDC050732]|uniref:PqqD family protein n=1 Tax=Streptomyces sp. NPDC050732 TaxID=3154632 RepID=UPI00342F251E
MDIAAGLAADANRKEKAVTSFLSAQRRQALDSLLSFLVPDDRAAVARSAGRLRKALAEREAEGPACVLVGYGGGKDSTYTLSFVRAMQLLLADQCGQVFTLRAVTNRHAGMPGAVMENIDRAYRALGMLTDPDCELLLVDGTAVSPFRADAPLPPDVAARNRLDILMTGHRTGADGRPTFCNACNLSVANSFGVAAAHGRGADVIVTGDSAQEQRAYTAWIVQLARQVPRRKPAPRGSGFPRVLGALDDVAHAYFSDIHDADDAAHTVCSDVPPALRFFSIYEDTDYEAGSHWDLLTRHLGFVFDELAFNFTESDCANPALMAHLRGLKCQYVYGRSYQEGLEEYLVFALALMRRKEFPQALIDTMMKRYAAADAHDTLRARVNAFARSAYGLDEEQLICMVHSPFTARAHDLRPYLERRAEDLVPHEKAIHELLRVPPEEPNRNSSLAARLEEISGLHLHQLRALYGSEMRPPLVQSILRGDPHKGSIQTRHAPQGPQITEVISGR